ncbi:MAG: hypothetical protein N3G20_02370 [Verrucomicrobiae bacterium]|nr:hypothetical protein [Verrucomicrobiae bacterium]
MPLPIDEADFVDQEVQAGRARVATSSPAVPRPPTREELSAKVTEAQQRIAELKRAQEELERERSALEEARRRRAEFEAGRAEVIEQLTRGIGLLEKAEFEARRNAEGMAKTLSAFKESLAQVQAIKEETWTLENWNTELTRALTTIENARMELNSARLKWSILNGTEPPGPQAGPAGETNSPRTGMFRDYSFLELCKLGLAFTWPLTLVTLIALVTIAVILWQR